MLSTYGPKKWMNKNLKSELLFKFLKYLISKDSLVLALVFKKFKISAEHQQNKPVHHNMTKV